MRNNIKITSKNFLFGLNAYFIGKSLHVKEMMQTVENQFIIYFTKNSLK
jgi:hypothetical protein